MGVFERFKRVPGDEPRDDQDVILSDYAPHVRPEVKSDSKGDYERMVQHETTINTVNTIHRTAVERIEDHEHRLFGTRIFSFFYDNLISGWRAGLFRAFSLSLCALIFNIAIYAWLFSTNKTERGSAVVASGPCGMIHNIDIGVHAGLNIMSTLILGASTYAMQGMTAPTRKEVDTAHTRGKWVEIGVQSWRNLTYVSKRNAFLWSVLAITSLPFHLFFNAVFFTTSETNQYAVAVVDETYLTNTFFQPTKNNTSPSLFDQQVFTCDDVVCDFNIRDDQAVVDLLLEVRESRNDGSKFVYMDPNQCLQNYSHGFLQKYSDVVVVSSSQSDSGSPILWTRWPQTYLTADREDTNNDPFHWVCHDTLSGENDRCSEKFSEDFSETGKNWTVYRNSVDYCLARHGSNQCHLQFNVWLMLAVVVCGVLKVFAIAWIVFSGSSKLAHLRTLGDAIKSYLEREDPTTKNMSLVSSAQIRKHGFRDPFEPQVFTGVRPRWYSAANTFEFFFTVGLSGFYAAALAITLYFAIDGAHGAAFDPDLGTTNIQSLATFMRDDVGSSGIIPLLLVANIPQLGVSLLYVVYTGIWGKLAVTREFNNMAKTRKGLRVSDRAYGRQRATHFLTLPIRYAVPLLACSAAMHWLCSQSLFLVRFDGIKSNGQLDEKDRIVRLGYNVTGMLSLIGVLIAMMVVTMCLASFKRLETPLGETCMSCVISAACHARHGEDQPWLHKVQWGDAGASGRDAGEEEEGRQVVRRCGFTAGAVQKPIVGESYD